MRELRAYGKTVPKIFTRFKTGKVRGLKGKFHNEGSSNSIYYTSFHSCRRVIPTKSTILFVTRLPIYQLWNTHVKSYQDILQKTACT
jgi:hypothetical protein